MILLNPESMLRKTASPAKVKPSSVGITERTISHHPGEDHEKKLSNVKMRARRK
jgi:hypothetical protein